MKIDHSQHSHKKDDKGHLKYLPAILFLTGRRLINEPAILDFMGKIMPIYYRLGKALLPVF